MGIMQGTVPYASLCSALAAEGTLADGSDASLQDAGDASAHDPASDGAAFLDVENDFLAGRLFGGAADAFARPDPGLIEKAREMLAIQDRVRRTNPLAGPAGLLFANLPASPGAGDASDRSVEEPVMLAGAWDLSDNRSAATSRTWTLRSNHDNSQAISEIFRYLEQHPDEHLIVGRTTGHVLIDHTKVSSRHAWIGFDGQSYWVIDLQTPRGTYVRGKRLSPGRREPINSGEVFSVADFKIAIPKLSDDTMPAQFEPRNLCFGSENLPAIWPIFKYLKEHPGASVILGRTSPDVRIDHPKVSSRHASIGFDGQSYWIRDLVSSNGTYLHGKSLRLAPGVKVPINIGDNIYLSDFRITVSNSPEDDVPAPAPKPPAPAAPAGPVAGFEPEIKGVAVALEIAALRDRVRQSGRPLLFTRNVDKNEFMDMVRHGAMRTNGGGRKYWRAALGTEYGDKDNGGIVVVMKPSFWETEKDVPGTALRNIFLSEIDGVPATGFGIRTRAGAFFGGGFIDRREDRDGLLLHLAENVDYNRCLDRGQNGLYKALGVEEDASGLAGRSILLGSEQKFMGYFPQLEVSHDVNFDQIETILVAEHMWKEVNRSAQMNKTLAALLQEVEGTGATTEKFLEGRDLLGRRTRMHGGTFEPNFGYDSFFKFEQAYFSTVLRAHEAGKAHPAAPVARYEDRVTELMGRNGYGCYSGNGWIFAEDIGASPRKIDREPNDWKIFVNPREGYFMATLEKVAQALSASGLRPTLKVPYDLKSEWRPGRPFGSAASTPKIVIYVSRDTLPVIVKKLDKALSADSLRDAHFVDPDDPSKPKGPSFARAYGNTGLIFYKREYFRGRVDVRVDLAEQAARVAAGDEHRTMERKRKALQDAGFVGENFYRHLSDGDPLEPAK